MCSHITIHHIWYQSLGYHLSRGFHSTPNTSLSAQTQSHPTKNPSFSRATIPRHEYIHECEGKIEALSKNFEYLQAKYDEKEAQNDYLRKQLDTFMKEKRRNLRSSSSSRRIGSTRLRKGGEEALSDESSNEDESPRFPRREPRQNNNFNDFKVDIPEFEGHLDPDDFLEWIQTVERVFEYKEVPDE